jgi:phospholipase C
MSIDQNLVKTIIVVMLENRSFDNLLGYLSLKPYNRKNVNGLQDSESWKNSFANIYNGIKYPPFPLIDPYRNIDADPPHERADITKQMGTATNGKFPLN